MKIFLLVGTSDDIKKLVLSQMFKMKTIFETRLSNEETLGRNYSWKVRAELSCPEMMCVWQAPQDSALPTPPFVWADTRGKQLPHLFLSCLHSDNDL